MGPNLHFFNKFLLKKFYYLLIYFLLSWVFLAVQQAFSRCDKWRLLLIIAHWLSSAQAPVIVAMSQQQMESSQTRNGTRVCCIARQILNYWTTREAPTFFKMNIYMVFSLGTERKYFRFFTFFIPPPLNLASF